MAGASLLLALPAQDALAASWCCKTTKGGLKLSIKTKALDRVRCAHGLASTNLHCRLYRWPCSSCVLQQGPRQGLIVLFRLCSEGSKRNGSVT